MAKKEQILINFHIHSTGSDGKMTPEEAVKEAISAGISYMCFTDHYKHPLLIESEWPTEKFHSLDYIKNIKQLQKKYKSKINIAFGAEFDWVEQHKDWFEKETKRGKYDYIIGSLHVLIKEGKCYPLDFGKEGKQKWIKNAEDFGGIKKFVEEYYRQTCLMARAGFYDSVGHLDTIKMYNSEGDLFSENDDWYQKAVLSVLDAVAKSKMTIEINVHGLIRATQAQYPSLWILKEARKRNIPVTIGTDAHRQGEVDQDLDKAYKLAREAGYKEIVRFKARKRISIPI